MKQDFLDYCKHTFFRPEREIDTNTSFLPLNEFEDFEKSLSRPLKKTLRINTNRVSSDEFRARKEKDGWVFGGTNNPNVWHIDRTDTSTALGSTPEHLAGDFYIQELSASQTVFILAEGKIHSEPLRILEMASSPGGKTTQLAEHYPNSFIAANEFTKDRINALLDNIERMKISNYGVSRLNGVQFRDYPEMFDLVLLDAPCSGE
jgi:16S rRNA (cytosine1407-C5)-methyltransferase